MIYCTALDNVALAATLGVWLLSIGPRRRHCAYSALLEDCSLYVANSYCTWQNIDMWCNECKTMSMVFQVNDAHKLYSCLSRSLNYVILQDSDIIVLYLRRKWRHRPIAWCSTHAHEHCIGLLSVLVRWKFCRLECTVFASMIRVCGQNTALALRPNYMANLRHTTADVLKCWF